MHDVISRQAAIDAIVAWAKDTNEMPDGDDCIMIICDLPSAQPEPQWIPTAKRLPEIKQRVLITYNTEDGLKTDVTWYDTYGFMLSENVTAWMPMVGPYRAERKTDEKKNI